MLTYSLDYESKWWLPVPTAFPTESGERLEEWAHRIASSANVAAPWNEPPWSAQLPELLAAQQGGLDAERSGALWYCPYGLPAVGVVQLFIAERDDDDDVDLAAELGPLPSTVAVRPTEVRSAGLGAGIGYSRILADDAGEATVAELGYLFAPSGARVVVLARSADPQMIGLMAPELWALVDSLRLERA
ncbi:hypothetical protein [Agromyces italicus]|uniref:hypothetical protein n=1 Tax=Agromyces italicus TaxID=279572 RepID=UPI0003B580FF|nr:hypothetical protein [Agromyces italicus]